MSLPRRSARWSSLAVLAGASACAQVLGVSADASTLEDFCSCDALRDVAPECRALAKAKEDDVKFLSSFVSAGCADCANARSCYAKLGAVADGASCQKGGDCASLRCCDDEGASVCCSSCRTCADPASTPAAHCTPVFESLRKCLVVHLAECPVECTSVGPTAFGDPCFACLYPKAAECNSLRFACEGEG